MNRGYVMLTEAVQPVQAAALAAEMRAMRLHDLIKGRREHLGLSQEIVAKLLAVRCRTYGNWERAVVKEWTDEKLHALAAALEMTAYHRARLFWLAVGRAPQPDPGITTRALPDEDPETAAFLRDYHLMMDALSLPTLLIDHRWNTNRSNKAFRNLFRGIRPHPTAMPETNFQRFVLFHPDAPTVLVDHQNWTLSMLAELASGLERHNQDPTLRAIHSDVHEDPHLKAAYYSNLPTGVPNGGNDLVHSDSAVLTIRHPDPALGLRGCRLVGESPRPLSALGLTRITLILTEPDDRPLPERGHAHNHHA
jgi:DNA-binding XRE family transcriptional regulator